MGWDKFFRYLIFQQNKYIVEEKFVFVVLSTGSAQINHEIEVVCTQCSFVSCQTTFYFIEYPNDHYLFQMLIRGQLLMEYKSQKVVCVKEELQYGIVLWVPISHLSFVNIV